MNVKKVIAFLIVPLPSFVKLMIMRYFLGYNIAPDVRIGLSFFYVGKCEIGRGTRIGHFNYISKVGDVVIGENAIIGHFNILMGGYKVTLGEGAMIGRFNEINSILKPLVRGTPNPCLVLGRHSVVTAWHKIDFTDHVLLGDSVILAGRLSNVWTHNRQDTSPVSIGENCYVGSGIQMAPGSHIGKHCVVGLGSVITRCFTEDHVLIAGVPAKVIKPLKEDSLRLVTFPTRPDLDGSPSLDIPVKENIGTWES